MENVKIDEAKEIDYANAYIFDEYAKDTNLICKCGYIITAINGDKGKFLMCESCNKRYWFKDSSVNFFKRLKEESLENIIEMKRQIDNYKEQI